MLKKLSFIFCLLYPFAVVGANSPLWSDELLAANRLVRHLLVAMIAAVGFISYKNTFNTTTLSAANRWIMLGVATSITILLAKLTNGMYLSLTLIYSSIEPIFVIGAAAAISRMFIQEGHVIVITVSFIFSLLFYGLLHLVEGLELFSTIYNRPRLILGFMHPGKLAQHLTIVTLLLLYFNKAVAALKFMKVMLILLAILLVALTNTRAMIVVLAIALLFKAISRFRSSDAKNLAISIGIVVLPVAASTFLLLDDETIHFIFSGRLTWWATALAINFQEYGWSMFILGVNGEPISLINTTALELEEPSMAHSFRVDNGFLEVLIYHGIIVLGCYIAAMSAFVKRSNFKNNEPLALTAILVFFVSGESGMFAVGNSFGIILVAMIAALSRLRVGENQKWKSL